ncbi:MAG: efflux RND transporter permease subunit, partial [Minwuiales bacterium]|nr:efflux RND transporter permease subunit [Minwuiales bacterium]
PLLAAVRGSKQIAFAVVATTVVLVCVFLPISFQGGDTGRLFREFGIAVAAAVIFSSFVALTLTPMLCSKWLRPHREESLLVRATDVVFDALANGYRRVLAAVLRIPVIIVAATVAVSSLAYLWYEQLPKEFAPTEDRGGFYISINAPEGASLDYTRRYVMEIEDYLERLRADGDLRRNIIILSPSWRGPGAVNRAFIIARVAHWDERTKSTQEVIDEINPVLASIPGVRAHAVNPRTLGRRSWTVPVSFIIGGPSYPVLNDWADRIIEVAEAGPMLLDVNKNFRVTRPELQVQIDRDRAADLGVPVEDIGRTLETLLGERRVGTFAQGGKLYDVIMRARPEDRATPGDLSNFYVKSDTTERLIPLGNLVTIGEAAGALTLKRVDRLRAITVSANIAPGYTLDNAL